MLPLQFSLCHNPASNFELFCFLRTLLVAFKCSKAVLFFDFLVCVPLTVALKRGTALVMSAAMGASFITVYHWYAYFFHHLGCHPFVSLSFFCISSVFKDEKTKHPSLRGTNQYFVFVRGCQRSSSEEDQ